MATRFYWPSSGTAPLAALSFGATGNTWNKTTAADRLPMSRTTTGTALTTVTRAANGVNPSNVLARQYQSEALPSAGTLSGTVRGIARVFESANTANVFAQLLIYVVSGTGATERGVALAFNNAALSNEWTTGISGRAFPRNPLPVVTEAALTNVTYQAGDRIIVEVGFRHESTATTNQSLNFGDDQANDLDDTVAASSATGNTWIEFSQDIFGIALDGSSRTATDASGSVVVGVALDGSTQSANDASGTVTIGGGAPVALAGDGRTAASSSATLQLRIAASSGTASTESGTLALATALVSDSRTAASASGSLRLLISGSSQQANTLSAGLAIATALSGSSQSAQADAGTLTLGGQIPIAGSSSTAAAASGTSALATALASSSRTATDGRGSIQLVILGAAVTASRTSGTISVEVAIAGLSASGALGTASLQIAVALSGSARAAAEASGTFRFGGPTARRLGPAILRRSTSGTPRRTSTPTPRR